MNCAHYEIIDDVMEILDEESGPNTDPSLPKTKREQVSVYLICFTHYPYDEIIITVHQIVYLAHPIRDTHAKYCKEPEESTWAERHNYLLGRKTEHSSRTLI